MADVARATRKVRGRGAIAGRYFVLFEVGKGGMGTVDVALERGTNGVQRIVALKRLLPQAVDENRHREMFLREARLAALLTHPNVVHAFAFGEDSEPYLAMEFVEGESLARMIDALRETKRAIPASVAAFIVAEIAEGLHAVHELRDVDGALLHAVHRDLSPHNVMLSDEGQVKLLDFGIAKFEAPGAMTRTGEIKGKVAYMSPEQALGEPLDRRSDLYSLGAILFECLTGARMWGTGTDLDVMRKLALETAPSVESSSPGVPKELNDLCATLVARESSARPPTAADVAQKLRAFLRKNAPEMDRGAVALLMAEIFEVRAARRKQRLAAALEELDRSSSGTIAINNSETQRVDRLSGVPTLGYPAAPATQEEEARATRTQTRQRRRQRNNYGLVAAFTAVVVSGIFASWQVLRRDKAPELKNQTIVVAPEPAGIKLAPETPAMPKANVASEPTVEPPKAAPPPSATTSKARSGSAVQRPVVATTAPTSQPTAVTPAPVVTAPAKTLPPIDKTPFGSP